MSSAQALAVLLERWTGIDLTRGGRAGLLEQFLRERAKVHGVADPSRWLSTLGPRDPEVVQLVNSVTVTYTWFYRDEEQMEVLAGLLKSEWPGSGKRALQAWVPGCATGEDAYTLAMLARRAGRPIKVLATDINSEALEHARRAEYGAWARRAIPASLEGYLRPAAQKRWKVEPSIASDVTFEEHNLLEAPPVPREGEGWDLVLCRNVLIYFREETILETHRRLARALAEGGWMLFGASEVVYSAPPGLSLRSLQGRMALHRPLDGVESRAGSVVLPATHLQPVEAVPKPVSPTVDDEAPRYTPPARTDAAAFLERGHRHLSAGELGAALSAFGEARERDPLCVEAHLFTGMALHLAGDAAAAAATLRAALFLEPKLWPAEYYLALSLDSLGKPEEARACYRRLLEEPSPLPLAVETTRALAELVAYRDEVVRLARRRVQGRVNEQDPHRSLETQANRERESMRQGLVRVAGTLLMVWSSTALAGAPEVLSAEQRATRARERVTAAQQGIEKQLAVVSGWAALPEIVAAVKEQNAKGPLAGMDNTKWAALGVRDPVVLGFQENAAGKLLRDKMDTNPKLYVEIFLNGSKGEKAAFVGKTTYYLHKGKPKFDVPFGTGKPWQGKAEFDESSQTYSIQVSAPVVDAGKPIGVLVVGMPLVELEKK